MKSIGDTLRAAREERGISIDQAVHETNISRTYLEALESEDFSAFPAEAYLIGFLKNYAEFLGLEPEKIAGQFKNYKLSEEPTPIEQLVGPPKGAVARKVLLIVFAVLALGAGGFFGVPRLIGTVKNYLKERAEKAMAEEEVVPPEEIVPDVPLWEGEIRPGDTLVLKDSKNGKPPVRLTVGAGNGKVFVEGPEQEKLDIMLGEEVYILGDTGHPAWRLYLKDMGLPDGSVVMEIQQLPDIEENYAESTLPPQQGPPSGIAERKKEPQKLISDSSPQRFTLDIAFRGYCLFRYKLDNQEPQENYYQDGDNFRLDVGRTVTLWASNAGALYAKIGGKELTLGRRGEVVTAQIRWVLNEETGLYELTVFPVY